MMTNVGNCPRCGAPMYSPTVWHAVIPPPVHRSCGCFPGGVTSKNTTTTNVTVYR